MVVDPALLTDVDDQICPEAGQQRTKDTQSVLAERLADLGEVGEVGDGVDDYRDFRRRQSALRQSEETAR